MAQANRRPIGEREPTKADLEASAKTKQLMEDAAAAKVAAEKAAAEKMAEDDKRAREEDDRVAAERAEAIVKARADAEAAQAEDAKNLVVVTVPKAFRLNLDNHKVIEYAAGTYAMPKKHAEHWYAKAHGVVPAQDLLDEQAAKLPAGGSQGKPTSPQAKALNDAVNAMPGQFKDADGAVSFLSAQFGSALTEDLQAAVRAKFA